jgi:chaperonin cofactor prefoldin
MDKSKLLEKISRARSEISTAEGELEDVMRELEVLPRAEKTTVTKTMGDAFEKLRAAKANLIDLETTLKKP